MSYISLATAELLWQPETSRSLTAHRRRRLLRLRTLQKDAPVLLPNITKLTPADVGSSHRSDESKKIRIRSAASRSAKFWKESVPVYRIPGVRLESLVACRLENKPNNKADKETADSIIDSMKDQASDACSAILQDEAGKTLLAVFSHHLLDESQPTAQPVKSPAYPGPLGRSK